ncbi:Outer membrane protein [Rhodovastum atsumiense]|uniref:OmpA family protein n=1 Tax=Rhodovastum atsumiense TaxID=504468 RepID=A0A5M6IS02_9PROT|nr:OmpA family protein [Rhodovastum atsumiense]KAA5611064.1 OmpA family protein [Rhodovastum atsumiense]CAH2599122.1 Outer membrane protein [Rhodovastum atsumiense]
MTIRNALLAASVLALPAVAQAQPINGLYVGGGLGYNYTQDIDTKGTAAIPGGTVSGSGKLTGNGGLGAVGSVGWGFGNGVRVELEGNYRENHTRLSKAGAVRGGADLQTYGVMINGLYDFDLGLPVTPYAGAGIGYEWTQVSSAKAYLPGGPNQISGANKTEGSLATQAILGASYALPVPGLSLTAEYRFMATVEEPKYKGSVAGVPGTVKLGNQYNHAAMLGVRYAFNSAPAVPPPAPAPVVAPAPAPSRTYLVFFDWDRAELTARARQIIAEAAQNSTRVQLTQIEVAGHADRTGTARYNLALSRKRAENVAAELVRNGVPRNVIAIQAYGDSRPLVPTAAGVREPQNRRVEIVLK